jgi:hypothetical protein
MLIGAALAARSPGRRPPPARAGQKGSTYTSHLLPGTPSPGRVAGYGMPLARRAVWVMWLC